MKLSYGVAVAALAVVALCACGTNETHSKPSVAREGSGANSGAQISSWRDAGVPGAVVQVGHASSDGSAIMRCRGGNVVFHCRTVNDKEITLCGYKETIEYSFGRSGKTPELLLSVPRDQATTSQWQGIGRWMTHSVTIQSGNARYTVFTSLDRLSDEHQFEAGVIAEIDGDQVARVLCKDPVEHELEGVDLRREE